MPRLYNVETDALLGTISDDDLQFLVDQLEEEDSVDDDYFIDAATLDLIASHGAPEPLVSLLRAAVGDSDGIDIRYEREG